MWEGGLEGRDEEEERGNWDEAATGEERNGETLVRRYMEKTLEGRQRREERAEEERTKRQHREDSRRLDMESRPQEKEWWQTDQLLHHIMDFAAWRWSI